MLNFKDSDESYRKNGGLNSNVSCTNNEIELEIELSGKKLIEYVDKLLTSDDVALHELAFHICSAVSLKHDGWFRKTLALMYWNGVGIERNPDKAREIMGTCEEFIDRFPIKPLRSFVVDVFRHNHVFIHGTDEQSQKIYSACIQNNLDVDGFIGDGLGFPTHLPIIDVLECPSDAAVIIYSEIDCTLPEDVDVYGYISSSDPNVNSLFRERDIPKDSIIIGEQSPSDIYTPRQKLDGVITEINRLLSSGTPASGIALNYEVVFSASCYLDLHRGRVRPLFHKDLCFNIILGREIYNGLPEGRTYLVPLYGGLGDQVRPLCKMHTISVTHELASPVAVVNTKARDLPRLFGYKGIILAPPFYAALRTFIRATQLYCGGKVLLLESWPTFPGISTDLGNLILPYGSARGSKDTLAKCLSIPPFKQYDPIIYPVKTIEGDFSDAVLINPYGNYIQGVSNGNTGPYLTLFERLSERLAASGIRVYTNSINSEQLPVGGSLSFTGTLYDVVSICRSLKCVVTIYSGFMELLLMTDANQIVITPNPNESRQYMADINMKQNYWEYQMDTDNLDALVDSIFNRVMECVAPETSRPCTPVADVPPRIAYYHDCTRYCVEVCRNYPQYGKRLSMAVLEGLDEEESELTVRNLRSMTADDAVAEYLLSKVLGDENGRFFNINESIRLLLDCYRRGLKWAGDDLYVALLSRGQDGNEETALGILRALASEGDQKACRLLSKYYKPGSGDRADWNEYIRWLREASELGDSVATCELIDALWFVSDESTKHLLAEMAEAFKTSDNPRIIGRLARMYRGGVGVERNIDVSVEMFERAYSKDKDWARNELIDVLWARGRTEDKIRLFHLAQEGDSLGDPNSTGRLGKAYKFGIGTDRDVERARMCFQRASKQDPKWLKEIESCKCND